MNREIKFRGKRVDNDGWAYGNLQQQAVKNEEYYITSITAPFNEFLNNSHIIDPKTVGQYTGLKDKNGNLNGVKIIKLKGEKNPETGRMEMKEIPGTEQILEADIVLIAAGFLGCQKYVADAFKVELNPRTNVKTDPGSYQTNVDRVFVTGDMHRGQSLVVWAIREGREAARQVDESLERYTNMCLQ